VRKKKGKSGEEKEKKRGEGKLEEKRGRETNPTTEDAKGRKKESRA